MISFEEVKEKVEALGYKIELKNNGIQFYIKCDKGAVNYYPKNDRWVSEKNKSLTGLNKMIKYLKENANRLMPKPKIHKPKMPLREYICMCVFEWVFSDSHLVEDYGFKTWVELYDFMIDNEMEELKTKDGEKNWIITEYEGTHLPTLLQELYSSMEYLVKGVKRFNVDFYDKRDEERIISQ